MANSKRKCKRCGEYVDVSAGVKHPAGFFCSQSHAVEFAIEASRKLSQRKAAQARSASVKEEKVARAVLRERKMSVKPLSWFREKAKRACHAYIRARDEGVPCPCCGATEAAQWDAAHYRPAGVNSSTRFDERNIHRCCQVCNQHKGGNLTPYRIWMVAKYGEEFVRQLDNNHEITRRTREDLEAIEAEYKAKLKELLSSR